MMYYIYHVPGKKIGCTKNIQRVQKQGGIIVYETIDIMLASLLEKTAQIMYNYKVDKTPYHISTVNLNCKGIPKTQAHKDKLSIPKTQAHKDKISKAAKGYTDRHWSKSKNPSNTKFTCWCGKVIGGKWNLKQHQQICKEI